MFLTHNFFSSSVLDPIFLYPMLYWTQIFLEWKANFQTNKKLNFKLMSMWLICICSLRGAITKKNEKFGKNFQRGGGGLKKQTKIPNFNLGIWKT